MAIPPAKIKAGCCYSGEGDIDRRVTAVTGDRVYYEIRKANLNASWGEPRSQILRAFARLVHNEIDCQTGQII
jgi:hypothetical protein